MDFKQTMDEAVGLHRSGRFVEAVTRYRAVLAAFPAQPDALHLLGLALNRLGEATQALVAVESAVAAQPDNPAFRFSLGNLLLGAKRHAEAEAAFRAVLVAQPDDPAARNGLAVALQEQGKASEAEAEMRATIARFPDYAPALDNLAAVLLKRNQRNLATEAEALARHSLDVRPDSPEALNNLGSALVQQRREVEAEPVLVSAVRQRKDYDEAWFNLALARVAQHKLVAADAAIRAALKRDPNNIGYLVIASRISRELSLSDEALELAQKAYALDPESPDVMVGLAQAWRDQNDYEETERLLLLAAERSNNLAYWTMLGHVHWEMGRLDLARIDIGKVLAANPHYAEARYVWSICGRCTSADDPNVVALEDMAARLPLSDEERVAVEFALGKSYDDIGEHERGFAHYATGNKIKKGLIEPFAYDVDRSFERACRETFVPETIARLAAHGSLSEVPVFVVGLPRSGTTLTEQIISSHPDAYGAGELLKLREINARVDSLAVARGGRDYPHSVLELRPEDIRRYSQMYLDHLMGHAGESKLRIVDKMPLNLRFLGLIAVLFPRARVVHCVRDPMDNCTSIFFQNFGRGNGFGYHLDDLGHFYANCRSLTEMWKQQLPLQIMDFPYEQVVEDPETWARKLISFIGLPWDDRCLSFHENDRAVRTASAWQVKQPIYKRSVARWKRYGSGLDPLMARLRAEGYEIER